MEQQETQQVASTTPKPKPIQLDDESASFCAKLIREVLDKLKAKREQKRGAG